MDSASNCVVPSDEEWLRWLAGYGLPGGPEPVAAPPIGDVLGAVRGHRLVGVLAAAVGAGSVDLGTADRELVARAHEDAMREALLLEDMLLAAVEVLDAAGVGSRVLKGAALAHLAHPDPSERCFGDNDLLVAPSDIDTGVRALVAAGATRPVAPLSSSFDRRFAKSVTLRWSGSTELDLHRTLAAGPYGHVIVLDDLLRDPIEMILAGRALQTLPADLHLLHGAIHVALGDIEPRLGNLRDVALLAARPSVDPTTIIATAARWGCAAPVAAGLRATAVLGHRRSPIEKWADEFVPSDADLRRLEVYRRRDGRFRRQALASFSVMGWSDRLAFASALLWNRTSRS